MELEIIGTIVGLAYLWLEYRASIYLWIASIIMPAIYIFVYYEAGLYADFGINVYYLGAAIYGWCAWKYGQNSREVKELPITQMRCTLVGCFYYRTECYRYVDVSSQISGTMVDVDCGGCSLCRFVYL